VHALRHQLRHQPVSLCRGPGGPHSLNAALGTLISGRQRKDGKDWKTAYEYMQVYLQVGGLALWWAVLVAHPLPARLLSSCGMRSAWTSMTGWTS